MFDLRPVAEKADAAATKRERAFRDALALQLMHNLEGASDVTIRIPRLGKGRFVIAMRERVRTGDRLTTCEVGASLCSPRDEFDLLFGITVALGRLRKRGIAYEPRHCAVQTTHRGTEPHILGALGAIKNQMHDKWDKRWPSWAVMPKPLIAKSMTAQEMIDHVNRNSDRDCVEVNDASEVVVTPRTEGVKKFIAEVRDVPDKDPPSMRWHQNADGTHIAPTWNAHMWPNPDAVALTDHCSRCGMTLAQYARDPIAEDCKP